MDVGDLRRSGKPQVRSLAQSTRIVRSDLHFEQVGASEPECQQIIVPATNTCEY